MSLDAELCPVSQADLSLISFLKAGKLLPDVSVGKRSRLRPNPIIYMVCKTSSSIPAPMAALTCASIGVWQSQLKSEWTW